MPRRAIALRLVPPGLFVGLLLGLLAWTPRAQAASPEARAVVRQELAGGQWFRAARYWRTAADRDGAQRRIMGELRLRTRGRTLILESQAPEERDGRLGFVVERLYGTRAIDTLARLDPSLDTAFSVVIGSLGWNHLEQIPLPVMYQRGLDAVAKARPSEPDAVYQAAMDGAASGHDRWTQHMSAAAWSDYSAPRSQRVGIGIHMDDAPVGVAITKVVPGSPAARAGLRRRDHVLSVDGQAVTTPDELQTRLRGPVGTHFSLEVMRGGVRRSLPIEKASYDQRLVRSSLHEGVGVVRIQQFGEKIAESAFAQIAALETRNHGPLRGLVLDLRGNGGGLVSEAVELLQGFVEEGTLVRMLGRDGRVMEHFEADATKLRHAKLPLSVLIDKESASASELVAGSLKGRRALLLGAQSFGKGVQQESFPLPDGSGLKLTNAKFFTPDDSPHGVGVTPDVGLRDAQARVRASHPGQRVVDPLLRYSIDELLARP